MSEKLTRIRLRGKAGHGMQDWGEHSFEDMHRMLREYAEDMKARAETILAACPDDFEVSIVRGVHAQHFVREVHLEAKS